jgi:hypothetical protein
MVQIYRNITVLHGLVSDGLGLPPTKTYFNKFTDLRDRFLKACVDHMTHIEFNHLVKLGALCGVSAVIAVSKGKHSTR